MLVVGIFLIIASENLVFRDYGDFARVIQFMYDGHEMDARHLRWLFVQGGPYRVEHFNLASYVFWIFAKLQEPFRNYYDLRLSSISLKVVLLVFSALITKRITVLTAAPRGWRYIVFLLVCLLFFVGHTIGVAKSFYSEYCFLLFFPPLLLGLLGRDGSARTALLVVGSLGCALSKVQYFYLPMLVMLCSAAIALRYHLRFDRPLLLAMAAAQLLGLTVLADNRYKQLNYHQSTYFGSYMVLTPAEQRTIGLNQRQIDCVGVDAWGIRAMDPAAAKAVPGSTTCYGTQKLTLADVLRPYLRYPWVLPMVLKNAWPEHFTVNYFHVFHYFPYISASHPDSYGSGLFLLKLSELRERTITPLAVWILFAGLVAGVWKRAQDDRSWSLACLFLTLFVASQLCVGILGEGVRDLSKHWWAAQLALDALTLLLGLQAVRWHCNVMRSRNRRERFGEGALRHDPGQPSQPTPSPPIHLTAEP